MVGRSGFALLLAVTAGCAGPSSTAPPIAVGTPPPPLRAHAIACLLQAPGHVSLAEPVVPVTFVLRNAGTADTSVLARHTPLEGILGDLFDVARDGQRLPYRGRMVKRGPPEASEYVRLAPGDHVRATIDLLEGYDLSGAGLYTVHFTGADAYTCNEVHITRD